MTSLLTRFRRVRRGLPCPVCQRLDWCLVELDESGEPNAALCQRVESRRRWEGAGWFHPLSAVDASRPQWQQYELRASVRRPDLEARLRNAQDRALVGRELGRAARDLGVPVEALLALGVGVEGAALLFPMVDERARLIGIRTRYADGTKRAVRGSRNGLFVPRRQSACDSGTLFVCEGPTDTAALHGLGLQAVGRASAGAVADLVARYVHRGAAQQAVVVADRDDVGVTSARHLASALRLIVVDVRVVVPPTGKDARDAVRLGATRADFETLAAHAEPVELVIEGGLR